MMNFILRFIYAVMSLSPLLIIFILKNIESIKEAQIINESWVCIAICFVMVAIFACISYLCIRPYTNINTQGHSMQCTEIEIAEPKYIPIYIAYFVIALSIPYDWIIFCIIFILILSLVMKGKFYFFNPYLLVFQYRFYEVKIQNSQPYAQYKVFLISKQKIKNTCKFNNLARLSDWAFLDNN